MKINCYSLMICVASILTFASCKKESVPPPPTTKLTITVSDNLGNKMSGVQVSLYTNESDFIKKSNSVGSSQTNALGEVTFDGLSAIKYYWLASKDCKNNFFGSVTTAAAIPEKVNTNIMTVLENTGTITFTNNSSNPYKVYVNDVFAFEIAGGKVMTAPAKAQAFSIRVIQVSGYAVYPTDKTYTGSVSCGSILSAVFPN